VKTGTEHLDTTARMGASTKGKQRGMSLMCIRPWRDVVTRFFSIKFVHESSSIGHLII
jgi:hypothetical protein